jgi:SAM-dependent methyltransferase
MVDLANSDEYMEMYDYNLQNREAMPYRRSFTVDAKQLALKYIVDNGCRKILDYGCGHGTFKRLGNTTVEEIQALGYGRTLDQPGTFNITPLHLENVALQIDGFDDCIKNMEARYHRPDEVKEHYDAIIASHIIEHTEIPEAEAFIEWTADKADHLIITQPYTYNLYEWHHFYTGIDHKRPYDNANMYYWLEKYGWEITGIWRTDLKFPYWKWRTLLYRMTDAYMGGTSPFRMHTTVCKRR